MWNCETVGISFRLVLAPPACFHHNFLSFLQSAFLTLQLRLIVSKLLVVSGEQWEKAEAPYIRPPSVPLIPAPFFFFKAFKLTCQWLSLPRVNVAWPPERPIHISLLFEQAPPKDPLCCSLCAHK